MSPFSKMLTERDYRRTLRRPHRPLSALRGHPLGAKARRTGKLVADHPGKVVMRSQIGGLRIVDLLTGEQLPRIC